MLLNRDSDEISEFLILVLLRGVAIYRGSLASQPLSIALRIPPAMSAAASVAIKRMFAR